MRDAHLPTLGSSLVEILVSVQLVALVMVVAWPVHRLVLSAAGPSATGPTAVRTRAIRYVQAELEYLRSLSYDRFRDPVRCRLDESVPFPPLRWLPEQAEPGEPRPPAPLERAEIRVQDEPVTGVAADGCEPRRVSVLVYGQDPDRPLARGELLRVKR
ncbi:MAG: hypothetical protein QN116_04390 [Armatimonadota bacterium]|nr:hypothetical protein [Armatimonadota bacterium]